MSELILVWVPYGQARPETRAAFVEGGQKLSRFQGDPPPAWRCTRCEQRHELDDLGITYGEHVTWPMPVCPSAGCLGHGWLELLETVGDA